VIVASIEYAWTGVRSGVKCIKDLEQLRTIAVICVMLMENAVMNSELH